MAEKTEKRVAISFIHLSLKGLLYVARKFTKTYESHTCGSPNFWEGYFYLPAWMSGILLLSLWTS